MKDASEEVTGVFTIDHARQLAEASTTKRVKCTFEDHPSKLLEILRRAERYSINYENSDDESVELHLDVQAGLGAPVVLGRKVRLFR